MSDKKSALLYSLPYVPLTSSPEPAQTQSQIDIVNISWHIFLKDFEPYAASFREA